MIQLRKLIQKRFYNYVNSAWGFTFFLVLASSIITVLSLTLLSQVNCSLRGNENAEFFCSTYNFRHNIGDIQSEVYTAFEPIDVVYTWVNGSDPDWKKKKELWAKRERDRDAAVAAAAATSDANSTSIFADHNFTHAIIANQTAEIHFNLTTPEASPPNQTALNSTSTPSDSKDEDDTMSSNRYRDSEELRYSLRSLVKNAPWIRHIYLVTDNQIPYWLNLETPKLSIISHESIFANHSHLPVFSSPAIEANLHRIPGLSKKFIYFNDDVMLGSPVVPDDFVTLSGAHKFYMAWDVPKCAPGCSDSWIGDGFCDKACNVSSCNFDFPDCINGSNVIGGGPGSSAFSSNPSINRGNVQCSKGCPTSWLADKICDMRCKNEDCGWDAGDCGLNLVVENYQGIALNSANSILSSEDELYFSSMQTHYYPTEMFSFPEVEDEEAELMVGNDTATTNSSESSKSEELLSEESDSLRLYNDRYERAAALEVPVGTKAVYFNLSYFPCRMIVKNTSCDDIPLFNNLTTGFRYVSAEHNDFDQHIIHHSLLLSKHHALVVLLFHGESGVADEEDSVPSIPSYPYLVEFTVVGNDNSGNTAVFMFKLMVVERANSLSLFSHLPERMNLLSGSSYASIVVSNHFQHFVKEIESGPLQREGDNFTQSVPQLTDRVHILPIPYRANDNEGRLYRIVGDLDEVNHETVRRNMEGVIVEIDLPSHAGYVFSPSPESSGVQSQKGNHTDGRVLLARLIVTLNNATVYIAHVRFCALILQFKSVLSNNKQNKQTTQFTIDESFELPMLSTVCDLNIVDLWRFASSNYHSKFLSSGIHKLLIQHELDLRDEDLERSCDPRRPREKRAQPGAEALGSLLFIPLPVTFSEYDEDWVQVKLELFNTELSRSENILLPPLPFTERGSDGNASGLQQHPFSFTWRKIASGAYSFNHPHVVKGLKEADRVFNSELLFRWGGNITNVVLSGNSTVAEASSEERFAASLISLNTSLMVDQLAENHNLLRRVNHSSDAFLDITEGNGSHIAVDFNHSTTGSESSNGRSNDDDFWTLELGSNEENNSSSLSERKRRKLIDRGDLTSSSSRNRGRGRGFPSFLRSAMTVVRSKISSLIATITNEWFLSFEQLHQSPKHRRLTDTYGQSLIHVNRIYNKAFGTESRKVPAHVPHMIDRELMQEMQSKWGHEWNATSSHRFRSAKDMQYSFSYYYYAINRYKLAQVNPRLFLERYVDHDSDGYINQNEFRTLVAILKGKQITKQEIQEFRDCVRNSSVANETVADLDYEETRVYESAHGKVAKYLRFERNPTLNEVTNCSLVTNVLSENKDLVKRLYNNQSPIVGSDKEIVAFEMINDNLTETQSQLDSVRFRQPKFICINDNMKNPSPELEQVLRNFYIALFPTPSIFELPADLPNPTLHYDEYLLLQQQRRKYFFYYLLVEDLWASVSNSYILCLNRIRRALIHLIDYLENLESRDSLAKKELKAHHQQKLIERLRRDVARNPLSAPVNLDAQNSSRSFLNSLNHFHLFLSVIGVLLLVLLRQYSKGESKQLTRSEPRRKASSKLSSLTRATFSDDEIAVRLKNQNLSGVYNAPTFSIITDTTEPTENKLYAVNKLASDEYAFALRSAAMDEIDINTIERDYYQGDSFYGEVAEDEAEQDEEKVDIAFTRDEGNPSNDFSVSANKKKRRRKKKTASKED